jgi:ATP-dependent Clp protease ATP-binding subunit ClpC
VWWRIGVGATAGIPGALSTSEKEHDWLLRERKLRVRPVRRVPRALFRPWHPAPPAQRIEITGLLLEETRRKLYAQDVTLEVRPEAVEWTAGHGCQPESGARPMRRTIQREPDHPA